MSLIIKATLAASAAASVFASAVLAAPAADSGTFTLSQIPNPHFQPPDIRSVFIRAYLKHGLDMPPQLAQAVEDSPGLGHDPHALSKRESRQTGSVAATPPSHSDAEFVVPVQIGTPPQTIPMILDTGSAPLWTLSTDTVPEPPGRHKYAPRQSTTSRRIQGATWEVFYGHDKPHPDKSHRASGIVYSDRVQLGTVFVNDQAVQSAQQASPYFTSISTSSGVLGMAYSPNNGAEPSQPSFVHNLRTRLAKPFFTANLQKGRPGRYNFGYINTKEFTGSIAYAEAFGPHWTIYASGYQIGADKAKYQSHRFKTTVDTGSAVLLLPDTMVTNYYKEVAGSRIDKKLGLYTFPCSSSLPDFTFGIDQYRGHVPGRYMNFGRMDKTQYCLGGIQSSSSRGFDHAIFGDVLLKAQFVVFDIEEGRVGFANKKLEN